MVKKTFEKVSGNHNHDCLTMKQIWYLWHENVMWICCKLSQPFRTHTKIREKQIFESNRFETTMLPEKQKIALIVNMLLLFWNGFNVLHASICKIMRCKLQMYTIRYLAMCCLFSLPAKYTSPQCCDGTYSDSIVWNVVQHVQCI